MTRTDSFVIGTLVVVFALVAALVGIPSLIPAASTHVLPSPTPAATTSARAGEVTAYREGVLGHPSSVSPLTARTQADRDLVALVFSGLVRNGPSGTLVPDLAERWTVDESGSVWTFQLRDDAEWHDGHPVTSADVVFTIHRLQDPAYTGPAAGSWNEVTVAADGPYTVVFTLKTPLGGFLQAATQPIAPAHLLTDVPVSQLASDEFGRHPVGSGPFAVRSLDDDRAELVPAASVVARGQDPMTQPTDPSMTRPSPSRLTRPVPYLARMQFTFFESADALADAYRRGDLDAVSGLPPKVSAGLARTPGSRLLRYPGSTLTAVLFNLRANHPEFSDPRVRTALLEAIDRPAIIRDAFASAAAPASDPIPPTSPLFDATADPALGFDPGIAATALKLAGWTQSVDGWRPTNAKDPLAIEIISPDEASNPGAFGAAEAVARDWTRIGLTVTHTGLAPAEFVTSRLSKGDFSVAVGDLTIGLDPDLYPLLASSQTVTGGSNVIGLQDPQLDALLVAARGPGTDHSRRVAYSALQQQLAAGRYLLPLAFADESVVVRDSVVGPAVRQVSDPADRFWDVLTWRLAAGP
jgi:peptide/nickel transport system substrate-binding protein